MPSARKDAARGRTRNYAGARSAMTGVRCGTPVVVLRLKLYRRLSAAPGRNPARR